MMAISGTSLCKNRFAITKCFHDFFSEERAEALFALGGFTAVQIIFLITKKFSIGFDRRIMELLI